MPIDKVDDQQSGWRKPHGDDHDDDVALTSTDKKHHSRKHQAKVATPPVPSQTFKSKRTVVVAGGTPTAATTTIAEGDCAAGVGSVGSSSENELKRTRHTSSPGKAGATRRKQTELYQTAVMRRMSAQLVKETRKRIIAREKAEENERNITTKDKPKEVQPDNEESDDDFDPTEEKQAWLQPETRVARRKAKQMRGLRTKSVENLENDDLNHLSAQRPFIKSGGLRCPSPFGRKLIEDRQELVGILNLPRNRRIRKAGIKESHLACIVDVYRSVVFNALVRIEEDEAGDAGPLAGATKGLEEKGIRVSFFVATLGISPYLFIREILWASNRLHAHAVAGEMNRATWVYGCIGLCLMSEKELVEFIFNTCKLTDAGELEMGELDRLAKSFHLSNDVFWPAFSQQLEDINKSHMNGDLIMTLDFFVDMHHKFPMILYPALRAQELVQRRTLGLHVWGRLVNRLDKYLLRQKRIANAKPCCLCVLLGLKK